jgi:DNA-binding LytR/AlgR family response regulator
MRNEKLYHSASVLLVDDNASFIELISLLLHEIGISKIIAANSHEEGLKAFRQNTPDICIFDIDLGENKKNGIQLAEKIRSLSARTPIIFITSKYTEESYDQCRHVYPSCFMNKELSKFKLRQAIDLTLINNAMSMKEKMELEPLPPKNNASFVSNKNYFFKIGDSYKRIYLDDIAFFYAKDKLTYARLDNRNLPTTTQLKALAAELPFNFHRIHKTYLININHIEQIKIKEDTVVINGEPLPIGYTYKKDFLNKVHILK